MRCSMSCTPSFCLIFAPGCSMSMRMRRGISGSGKSAARVAEVGLGRVYLEHILRLRELAAQYDRRIMFWGDVILDSPELIPDIPDDVTVLHWDYQRKPERRARAPIRRGGQNLLCVPERAWLRRLLPAPAHRPAEHPRAGRVCGANTAPAGCSIPTGAMPGIPTCRG